MRWRHLCRSSWSYTAVCVVTALHLTRQYGPFISVSCSQKSGPAKVQYLQFLQVNSFELYLSDKWENSPCQMRLQYRTYCSFSFIRKSILENIDRDILNYWKQSLKLTVIFVSPDTCCPRITATPPPNSKRSSTDATHET
jgi:hypothetical protein